MKKLVVLALTVFSAVSYAQTAASFKNGEYGRSRALDSVKAAEAWAKGYTGKGVTIAILDSGINNVNNEFTGRIVLTRDFSGSNTMVDTIGHGTAVAGIAAAARNGVGTVGVAPDASLIIAKITSGSVTTGNIILQAMDWATTNNAKVVNLSANTSLTNSVLQGQLIAPGVYQTRYTNTGTMPSVNPYSYAAALKNDAVLVIAAGNNSTPWAGAYGQLATATDKNGNLILGGRVIIAGNWNSQTNRGVGSGNNGAAHLCQVMAGSVCQDRFQAWQFYLMAPGMGIAAPGTNSIGISTNSGTSMAAPTISGAVAIVRQMWPRLSGSNTVQILLQSANKNIPGYDKYQHGQGLLDLDAATRPLGTLAVPNTTAIAGSSYSSVQPILVTGGSASTARTQSLMMLDEFERDFYLPGKNLMATYTPNEASVMQTALPYFTGNVYTQFNEYNDYMSVRNNNVATTWYYNSSGRANRSPAMGEISYNTDTDLVSIKLTTGVFVERDSWLGNYVNGFEGEKNNKDSTTQYFTVGVSKEFSTVKVSLSATNGITHTDSSSDNIQKIHTILSYSWNATVEKSVGKAGTVGVMMYQPVSVYDAPVDLIAPVGIDSNDEVIQSSRANLAAEVRELRTGVYYKVNNRRDINLLGFAEYRKDYRGQEDQNDLAVGIVLTKKF